LASPFFERTDPLATAVVCRNFSLSASLSPLPTIQARHAARFMRVVLQSPNLRPCGRTGPVLGRVDARMCRPLLPALSSPTMTAAAAAASTTPSDTAPPARSSGEGPDLEGKVKRKMALHLGYVGTDFRGERD
jgi:hypothetical protein